MITIEIHNLESQIREALRLAREQGEMIDFLEEGEVIARLLPVPKLPAKRPDAEVWAAMDRLAEEISAYWPEGVSAVEAVREGRREL